MILDDILIRTREDLKKREKEFTMDWLGKSLAFNGYMPRDVIAPLTSTKNDPYKIIAEIKKASPSKGTICKDFDPLMIGQAYEEAGANVISVLTEPHFFKGEIEYLSQLRRYTSIPLLRKDFIISKYQILESLVYGADLILLIAKILSKKELKTLLEYTRKLGMQALVEIHDKKDLLKAIASGTDIIGINHRNLETFQIDMNLSKELIPLIPNKKIIVAESGIKEHEQIVQLNEIGVDAFLVGEYFMSKKDLKKAVKTLKATV